MPEIDRARLSAVEPTRRTFADANRRDYDAIMSSYGPGSVSEISPSGLGTYSGPAEMRQFF